MRVQVPPAAPMGGNAVRAASLSSFRADTITDTASTGSLRPPIPVDGTDLARPYQRSWAYPRGLLAGAALSNKSKPWTAKRLPPGVSYPAPDTGSGLTTRYTVFQYRPRAKAGRVTPRGPLTPGADLFHVFALFCVFFLFPPAHYHDAPCLRARPKTDCHGQCEHWPRNDNEVRL